MPKPSATPGETSTRESGCGQVVQLTRAHLEWQLARLPSVVRAVPSMQEDLVEYGEDERGP